MPSGPPEHCGHTRCRDRSCATAVLIIGGTGLFWYGIATLSLPWIAGGLAALTAGCVAAGWHCPADDIEALIDATREDRHPDFSEWEKELHP
jgi:hypothetical protein